MCIVLFVGQATFVFRILYSGMRRGVGGLAGGGGGGGVTWEFNLKHSEPRCLYRLKMSGMTEAYSKFYFNSMFRFKTSTHLINLEK